VKVLLIFKDSPVRERLVGVISELSDVQVEIREPDEVEVERTIAQVHPDVVLVDIDQSRGRGLEIIRQIHEQHGECGPVVMAMASSSSLQYRASCLRAGAMYFFNQIREQEWLLDSLASMREQLG
jgi:DNA-binding NarL/FixJ family response regulator